MVYNGPYVVPAYIRSSAARRTRLIGFDSKYGAAGFTLKPEHLAELDKLATFVSQTSSFFYWLVGYASKAGNHVLNSTLSSNRALAVEKYLASKNALFADSDRLSLFLARGDEGYQATAGDNSPDERAVEVHIFLGNVKPPPPPNVKPAPSGKPPLPKGPRFSTWQVAAAFGLQWPIPLLSIGPAGVQVVFNLFSFKKIDRGEEEHRYISLGGGGGLSLPGLGALKQVPKLWNAITAPSWSGFSYSDPKTADNPFSFEELDGADIGMVQIGGGVRPPTIVTPLGSYFVPTGWQFARLNVSGQIWYYDSSNQPFFSTEDMLTNVDVGGWQSALGAQAGLQAGRLIKIT